MEESAEDTIKDQSVTIGRVSVSAKEGVWSIHATCVMELSIMFSSTGLRVTNLCLQVKPPKTRRVAKVTQDTQLCDEGQVLGTGSGPARSYFPKHGKGSKARGLTRKTSVGGEVDIQDLRGHYRVDESRLQKGAEDGTCRSGS